MRTLTIDQSTSSTKAIVFDDARNVLARVSRDHAQHYPSPGVVRHDANEIWRNTLAMCQEAIRQAGPIDRVSVTNQRETFVLFDRHTGEPACPAVVWQCRSGIDVCDRLRCDGLEPLVRLRTGLTLDTYFSAPKFAAMLVRDASLRSRVDTGEVVFGTIDTYLIHRLTRGRVFATDATNASRTLLMDIRTSTWDADLCRAFGVPLQALPEVRDSSASFGTTDFDGLSPYAIPIVGVMGDSQAALLAHGCVRAGEAKVTLGTGSSILVHTGTSFVDGGHGVMSTVALQHAGVRTYCFEGVINYSAATIEWLRNQLRLIDEPHETEEAANRTSDNGGVYLVPAFAGLGAPHWLPDARGAIVGLSGASTRDHVLRAALESIGYQIADALDAMRQSAGTDIRLLSVDGRATGNAWLVQFIADVTQCRLRVATNPDCSALGAVLAGQLHDGASVSSSAGTTIAPGRSVEAVTAMRLGWNRAVEQVRTGIAR
jgi:glycerol kinase